MPRLLTNPQSTPLYDLMKIFQRNTESVLRVCVPGKITSVDMTDTTVNVQVCLLQQDADGVSYPYQELTGCPLIFAQGGGVAAVCPPAVGDECLVFVADRCIDSWFQSGSPQVLPNLRMHDLSDGFVLVGVNSLANVLKTPLLANEGGICESKSLTGAKVVVNSSTHKVSIKNNTEDLAVILTDLIAAIKAITTLNSDATTGVVDVASKAVLQNFVARIQALLY